MLSPILNPSQIPKRPPTAFPISPEKENSPDPQSEGINPPIVLPTKSPIQINVFLLMCLLYHLYQNQCRFCLIMCIIYT